MCLVVSKRPASGVWAYFKAAGDDECTCATFSAKNRIVSRGPPGSQKKSWSVKSLWVHLKTHHPEEHNAANAVKEDTAAKKKKEDEESARKAKIYSLMQGSSSSSKQLTFEDKTSNLLKPTRWSPESTSQTQAMKSLVYWICDAIQPYGVVENEQFKTFIHTIQPKFSLPSEKVLRQNLLPKLYKKVQFKLLSELNKQLEVTETEGTVKSLPFSITTDIWSSQARDSYMSVTLHFVTRLFKRKMLVLRALPYNVSHTGDSIKENVLKVLKDWGLGEFAAILRDSAANVVKAFLDMLALACVCHTLQLVVNHSVLAQSGIKLMYKRAKAVVKRLRTPKGKIFLRQHGATTSLKKDNETRYVFNFRSIGYSSPVGTWLGFKL